MVAPARSHAEVWRLIVGLSLIAGITVGLNIGLVSVLIATASDTWLRAFETGTTPGPLLVMLGSFGFVSFAVAVVVRQLHHRSFLTVLGPVQPALRQFWRVLRGLLLLMAVLFILPPYGMDKPLTPNLPPGTWLALLPLSLTALLVQTSAEEILFRGYMQQSLAARFQNPVIWIGLPSVLFAFGHYLPAQAGENAVLIAVWAGLFGMFTADLTARSGTLGPAIALHFFNNLIAIIFLAVPGQLSGLALYLLPYGMDDTDVMRGWLLVDFAMMVVCWLVARLALRR